MKSILQLFLEAVDVPFTRSFADRLYSYHRNRNNMYGLKRMLSVYGVKTMGVCVADRDVSKLNFPCILHTSDGFVIGLGDDGGEVSYLSQGRRRSMPNADFGRYWTGNALVVCGESSNAGEPGYARHRKEEVQGGVKVFFIPVLLLLLVSYGTFRHWQESDLLSILGVFSCVCGMAVCLVLAQRQVLGEGWIGGKACSVWARANCGKVLDSPRSKFFGVGWSEIGMGYFAAGALLLSVIPGGKNVFFAINLLAMGYGVWSVLYQWLVVGGWCVWCLMAQAVVWAMGLPSLFLPDVWIGRVAPDGVLMACLLIATMALLSHFSVSFCRLGKKYRQAILRYRGLKSDSAVFGLLLARQRHYEVSGKASSILFGNVDAKCRVTILLNPFCNPCAKLHGQVARLLGMYGDEFCVQYVFASFGARMENASRRLVSLYEEHGGEAALDAITKWYDSDRWNAGLTDGDGKLHTPFVDDEMRRQKMWTREAGLLSAPTVLVNGNLLPEHYRVEDVVMAAQCAPVE